MAMIFCHGKLMFNCCVGSMEMSQAQWSTSLLIKWLTPTYSPWEKVCPVFFGQPREGDSSTQKSSVNTCREWE